MRNLFAARPSPATVVAMVALIAALAGTATALPGKNTVDKNDLQKGAVTKRALKKAAVTTKAIKDGSVSTVDLADGSVANAKLGADAVNSAKIGANQVTGDDVDESTLGTVPSANSVSFLKQFNVRLAFGDDVELVSNGEVSLRARCVLNGTIDGDANLDGVQVYARTTAAGSFMDGFDNRAGDTNGDGLADTESLDPADAIDDSSFVTATVPGGAPAEQNVSSEIDQGVVVAPDGSYIGVDSEEMLLAVRALGSDCAVIGMAQLQG